MGEGEASMALTDETSVAGIVFQETRLSLIHPIKDCFPILQYSTFSTTGIGDKFLLDTAQVLTTIY